MHPNTIQRTQTWVQGPMERIGCVRCEKSERDFVARTFSWIAPVHTVLPRVSCSYKTITNAPKHNETYENMSLGSNGVDWVRSLRKIPTWLRGMNFALIAPVHPVLHRVSCSYETIPNAPKHYTTHQNMSLGSNGADWVHSLGKITTWLHGTNFCINCTSSHRFLPSFMQLQNHNKCTQTQWNFWKHKFRVLWVGSGVLVAKILMQLRGTNFYINCTNSAHFAPSFMQ